MENNFTVAVSHFVSLGKETKFEKALKDVIDKANNFAGYQRIEFIKLKDNLNNEYLVLVSFDKEENYTVWANSKVRKNWVTELKLYVNQQSKIRMQEGLEFWFPFSKKAVNSSPNKWKMVLITWLVISPLIIILSNIAAKHLYFTHPYLRVYIVSIVIIIAMTYVIMPKITNALSSWIYKK